MQFNIPILLISYNKIEETQRVFKVIRSIRPSRLYIASDGPRSGSNNENDVCFTLRKWLVEHVDWECEIKTLYHKENLGCGRSPSQAITWFFDHENEGIILEDDCLPNESFFRFCEENLQKYRDKEAISIISGNNFQSVQPMDLKGDYYYSVFPSTWGWATWKRTWEGFRFFLEDISPREKRDMAAFLFKEKKFRQWWINQYEWMQKGRPEDMWDYQFYFHCMKRKQLAIIPKANLVSNIGFGESATHTSDKNSNISNLPTYELEFPLFHPEKIERNYEADLLVQKLLFGGVEPVSPVMQLISWVKRNLPTIRK